MKRSGTGPYHETQFHHRSSRYPWKDNHIFHGCPFAAFGRDLPVMAFLGGIAKNYHNNLLIGEPYNGLHYVVVEADEYDRSF